ncbi:MAG: FMN-binding protein [Microbacterium sp.]
MTSTLTARAAAAASVLGVLALAGCAASTAEAEEAASTSTGTTSTTASPVETTETAQATESETSTYTDGTYTADGSYATPESVETITVTVTLDDDIVTAVEVSGNPTKRESEDYQAEFIGGIADLVVGKDIDDLSVSRVAGSSLTSTGFNEAIEQIKAEAAS